MAEVTCDRRLSARVEKKLNKTTVKSTWSRLHLEKAGSVRIEDAATLIQSDEI